jgi:hypothetical protein
LIDRRSQIIIKLVRILGNGRSPVSIITSASFVLVSLFYAYSVGSYLKVIIYPFENRIIYYKF